MKKKKNILKKKANNKTIQKPRGMKDILPSEYPYYDFVLKTAKKIF